MLGINYIELHIWHEMRQKDHFCDTFPAVTCVTRSSHDEFPMGN